MDTELELDEAQILSQDQESFELLARETHTALVTVPDLPVHAKPARELRALR
jgi:hypothetical protein